VTKSLDLHDYHKCHAGRPGSEFGPQNPARLPPSLVLGEA